MFVNTSQLFILDMQLVSVGDFPPLGVEICEGLRYIRSKHTLTLNLFIKKYRKITTKETPFKLITVS